MCNCWRLINHCSQFTGYDLIQETNVLLNVVQCGLYSKWIFWIVMLNLQRNWLILETVWLSGPWNLVAYSGHYQEWSTALSRRGAIAGCYVPSRRTTTVLWRSRYRITWEIAWLSSPQHFTSRHFSFHRNPIHKPNHNLNSIDNQNISPDSHSTETCSINLGARWNVSGEWILGFGNLD